MKTKLLMMNLLITLLLCLAGCSGDDATKALASIDDSGSSNSNNTSVTSKTYNDITGAMYESFTFKSDGILDYYQVQIGTGWIKAVGPYSFNTTTNEMTVNLTVVEASSYFVTNIANICTGGAVIAGNIPYTEVDANTYRLPNGIAVVEDFILDSLSGVTVPDLSAMPDACP